VGVALIAEPAQASSIARSAAFGSAGQREMPRCANRHSSPRRSTMSFDRPVEKNATSFDAGSRWLANQ